MTASNQTRLALQRVAVHIVARARVAETDRFSLRVTPGGFGTPEFGADCRRLRVSGGELVVESDRAGAASALGMKIAGSTLRALAAFAAVDLDEPLDVGHDTPVVGDPDEVIGVDDTDAEAVATWYRQVAAMLDGVLAGLPPTAGATLARLWPEHFDVALDASARPDLRVNLGGSPGDGYSEDPYLYVGPWSGERPGDAGFWNASFGAARTRTVLLAGGGGERELVAAGTAFLLDGYGRLV